MMARRLLDLLLTMTVLCWPQAHAREWVDSSGRRSFEAEFVETVKLTVKLKRPDGEVTSVALEKLSRYDQLYVRKLARDMDAAVQAQVSAISRAEDILKRIKKLGETKSPTNVGILLGLLQHTNSHVRLAAAQSLEKIGDETHAKAIFAAVGADRARARLQSDDPGTVFSAAVSILQSNHRRPLPLPRREIVPLLKKQISRLQIEYEMAVGAAIVLAIDDARNPLADRPDKEALQRLKDEFPSSLIDAYIKKYNETGSNVGYYDRDMLRGGAGSRGTKKAALDQCRAALKKLGG